MEPQLEKVHIESTPGTCGGKPRIAGTRIRVQDVYIWHDLMGQSADEIVAGHPHLSVADVYAALAYFWDHRDEIKQQMQADDEFVAALRAKLGPGPLERKLSGTDGTNRAIPSG